MTHENPDLHFAAIFKACEVSCELADVLPETDLVSELLHILEIQRSLIECIVQRKHFGDENIKSFVTYCEEVKWQVRRIGEDV